MIKEILAFTGKDELDIEIPVKASQGALAKGQVMARLDDASGYVPFNNSASNGAQKPVGILKWDLENKAATQVAPLYLTGFFKKSNLVGMDANAITAFGARVSDIAGEDLIILR